MRNERVMPRNAGASRFIPLVLSRLNHCFHTTSARRRLRGLNETLTATVIRTNPCLSMQMYQDIKDVKSIQKLTKLIKFLESTSTPGLFSIKGAFVNKHNINVNISQADRFETTSSKLNYNVPKNKRKVFIICVICKRFSKSGKSNNRRVLALQLALMSHAECEAIKYDLKFTVGSAVESPLAVAVMIAI